MEIHFKEISSNIYYVLYALNIDEDSIKEFSYVTSEIVIRCLNSEYIQVKIFNRYEIPILEQ